MKAASGTVLLLLSSGALADWKFSGNVAPYFQKIMIDHTTVSPSEKGGVSTNLEFDNKISSRWRFRSDTWIRSDFFARDAEENFQYVPRSLYLQYRTPDLTLKTGFQTMSLLGPDLINPSDIVHSKNFVDPTSPVGQSSAGISFAQEKSDWNWEVLYVPRQTPAVLPGAHSPWLPRENRLPIESENTEIRIPDNVEYQYLGAKVLNQALNHNFALKLQKKADAFEGQLLYYNGLSQSPFVTTRVTGTLLSVNPDVIAVTSPVRLQPIYYRHRAAAFTFNVPFETWALHGGINWMKPQGNDDAVPGETSLMVLGVEKSFETERGTVIALVDYVRQELQNENQISFLRSIFEEAVSAGIRVPFSEETQLFAGGMYDLVGSSSLYRATVTHRISSSISVEGQAQMLQGPSETLIGLYKKYDSYQLRLIWSW